LAPPLILPPVDEDHPQKRLTAIDILFPNPPPVSEIATPAETQVVTLEQLEEMAVNNNPTLVQARGNVTFNRGAAIQAGVYPNPSVGYETDSFGSGYSRNYEGVSLQQTVKTAGKLTLQRTIANMDMMNAELQWRRTELDVRRQVRAGYYNVLVAQEANKINTALLRFTNDVYLVQVQRLKNGEEAGYQPAQLRTLVVQARAALVQSQNRYISAWKQMAAAIGVPTLPPATLADRVDMPLPDLNFDALLEKVLNVYPDAQAARNLEAQARFNLRLQQVTPIPDVTVYAGFFRDTTDPAAIRSGTYNMTVSVPIPIFDKNIGNIVSAEGRLVIAQEQLRVVRNQLTGQLADAFERFQTNRVQAQFYREQILPDLARSYRGVYERNLQEPDIVAFGDIIVAQQNLSSGVSTYIGILLQQWVAVTDIANLLQLQTLGDFYRLAPADSTPAAEQIPLPPPTR
jgi:cobalt-zinc-cadmium efflux system outer membrane protein